MIRKLLFWLPAPIFGAALFSHEQQIALTALAFAFLEMSPRTNKLVPAGISADMVSPHSLALQGAMLGIVYGTLIALIYLRANGLRWTRLRGWFLVYPATFTLAGASLGVVGSMTTFGRLIPTGIAVAGLFVVFRAQRSPTAAAKSPQTHA